MENIFEALQTFNLFIAFSILIVYIITDALYAKYTLDVANHNEIKAATVGATIHFFLAFGIINYTQNWLYIFPLAIGSWVGTYFTVRQARLARIKK
ncbi:MAG: hypothetical protein RBS77_04155 [Candidatus Moranbacteria bacterium]|jgi:hypothetical protein|nr:hypothetical protein [Candidatus Moranbacteria bacterium]